MRLRTINDGRGCGESFANETFDFVQCKGTVFFTQGVVVKTFKNMTFLNMAAQAIVKIMLRRMMHHPVTA